MKNWCGEGDSNSRITKNWILSPAPLTTRQSPQGRNVFCKESMFKDFLNLFVGVKVKIEKELVPQPGFEPGSADIPA